MKKHFFYIGVLAGFTVVVAEPALASLEAGSLFFGGKAGYQLPRDQSFEYTEPEGLIGGVFAGYRFSPSFSWDIGYQYHDKLKADDTSVDVTTWLVESALRYDWYLQDDLSLYGRIGAAYWDMEKTHLSSNKSDAAGFSPLGEVGVNYHFNPNVRLSAGYQYIDGVGKSNTGKYDSHGLLVSLTYTFGSAARSTLVKAVPVPIIEDAPVTETVSIPIVEDAPVKEVIAVNTPSQTRLFLSKTAEGLLEHDSIELNQEYISQLTEVSSVLNSYPQSQAEVVGHTDSTGLALYNQNLSERRAQAAVNKLIELGVSPAQLEWRGEGASQPVGDNNTAEGRAKNRRVEVIIHSFQVQE
ncbi:OmpA family protein [uncultured Shewanella sp.]|uniref:OmpA family protein n=1 Tax=uncultured Shewanella sp. TaxID=173975 RepID=UPI00260FACF3|nr:OmpA family protein [uncultured Shewanella sp.]